jgi:hypothetical protein
MTGRNLSCHTAAMDNRGLQGWTADPFRLHEERYFSAGRPTKLVRDKGVDSYDEPPSDTFIPSAAPPTPDRPTAPPGYYASATPPPPGVTPPDPRFAPDPSYAPDPGYDWGPSYAPDPRYAPGPGYAPNPRFAPGPGFSPKLDFAPDPGFALDPRMAPDPHFAPKPSRARLAGLFTAATAIVATAVIAMVILVNDSKSPAASGQGLSSSAFVTRSAQRSLAERTADMTLSGTIGVAGKSFTVYATGQTNLDTNAMAFDLRFSLPGGALDEKEILVNGSLFAALSVNGKSLTQATGRTWIQMPFQQSASANLAGANPASSLSLLERQGITVQTLGTRMVGGVSCTGYAVTPSTQTMIAAVKEQASLGVSAATTNQELQAIRGMSPPTITLWIDRQNLVREMSMNLQMNVLGTSASANLVVDFSNYGVPVQITAPPPADTISYTSFIQKLAQSLPS